MPKKTKWAKFQNDMLYSQAFNSLNSPSKTILMYVLMQIKWENTKRSKSKKDNWVASNGDGFRLQYSTFKNKPFELGDKTITRSLDSLLAHGFITIVSQGGSKKGHHSLYKHSDKWIKWRKGDDPIEIRRPYHKRGFQNKQSSCLKVSDMVT